MLELTAEGVLTLRSFRRAVKIAPVKIRPFTEQDVCDIGPFFLDLEQQVQRVELDRYLCIGVQGERWTCGERSMNARKAISEPDSEGFRLYVQRNPVVVLATLVDTPFLLSLPDGACWQSSAGVITWNGLSGEHLIMRVVEKTIFQQTYQFLDD
jgi:hypothetical protein